MNQPLDFKYTEQALLETIADFLDTQLVIDEQVANKVKDPLPAHETELHINMMNAAMAVYRDALIPVQS